MKLHELVSNIIAIISACVAVVAIFIALDSNNFSENLFRLSAAEKFRETQIKYDRKIGEYYYSAECWGRLTKLSDEGEAVISHLQEKWKNRFNKDQWYLEFFTKGSAKSDIQAQFTYIADLREDYFRYKTLVHTIKSSLTESELDYGIKLCGAEVS
ncbi:hypothetical protein [Pseudoalteromonas luteoviolacea]|uniref:Uncharacterized protein n=1 Tax=Pseudoalteromonas luteoviolacea NCIMB 1942 TaxID=1365253 RepID=A0A167EBQ3_9GAMM|nr:hypothetical protein [Pseudoalteromonas luteoviolacea]KZN50367.1 hypothetical protein N482_25225 [Pseudoalteromonas luteoviolacea NCIMB 1942]